MATINISLPNTLAFELDAMVKRFSFSNRSEFIRSLLRRVFTDTALLQESAVWPFTVPSTRSKKTVMAEFKKTGKYSNVFMKDLKEGLNNSKYFKE